MNTAKVYAKKATKAKKKDKKKDRKKPKRVSSGTPPFFYGSFMKSWLLEPSGHYNPRISMALDNYNLPFKERYSRVLYFNTISDLEKVFWNKQLQDTQLTKYTGTQFDCLKAYRANQALRWSFKKLVLAWKYRKLQLMNENDPITMEPLKNPLYIYDYSTKRKYQIESKSLLVDSLNRLFFHDDFFPKSKLPRNLLTNEDLTFSQLWSTSLQMRKYGITHWCWEAFVKSSFCLNTLLADHHIPMKYEMIKRCFSDLTSTDANWFVSELILANTEGILAKALKWAIYHHPTHTYLLKWRGLCQTYWKLAVVQGETEAENTGWIRARIATLLEDTTSLKEIRRLYFETKI